MAHGRTVVLLPTYAQVVSYRTQRAHEGSRETFGAEVTTMRSWVEGLWELFGDGRTIIPDALRDAMLEIALGRRGEGEGADGEDARGELASPGTASLAARLARDASGLAEFERALEWALSGSAPGEAPDAAFADVLPAERDLLAALARYRAAARERGFVEPGEAMSLLPRAIAACLSGARGVREGADGAAAGQATPGDELPLLADRVTCRPLPTLSLAESRFLSALVREGVVREVEAPDAPQRIDRAVSASSAEVRFAFPSGRYAEPRLLVDLAEREADARSGTRSGERSGGPAVVIAAKDPAAVYEAIAAGLAGRGLSCAVRARKRFGETRFGVAYAAMRRCVTASDEERADLTAVSDVLLSPFSGVPTARAQRIDEKLRRGRTTTMGECREALRVESEPFERLEELALDPEASILVGVVEDAVRARSGETEAWRREQTGALEALRGVMDAVRDACAGVGCDDAAFAMRLVDRMLARATVDVSRENGVERFDAPDVLVLSLPDAAALGPGSCDVAVATDMTSTDYPADVRDDAGATLLGKLVAEGAVRPVDDALACQRAEMCALLALPTRRVYLERCLLDVDAAPTYPAAVAQELVDCFREDASAVDDIDNAYALPASLQEGLATLGEERLFANASFADAGQITIATCEKEPFGTVSEERRRRIVLPREVEGGQVVRTPCLSPSQIESYLECPYKWFAERRLRIEEIDRGFGSIEMGEFAHHALEAFYRSFRERTGAGKVTPALLEEARGIMREVLEEPVGSLVPTTELERRGLEDEKRRLVRFLDFEAELLPGFVPTHFEFDVPATAHVGYAGHEVLGRIDRIDVDARGQAVIVDYKSSVGSRYDLQDGDCGVPCKVQALVYARAFERLTGARVVGAVYVSYGRKLGVSGAYDPDALSEAAIPRMRHDRCRPRAEKGETFEGVLDATEERVAEALDRMIAGDVAPRPLTPSVCRWCPVKACPRR